MQTHTSIQQTVTSIMLRLLRRTGRLLLLPSKYPIILRVSSFARFRVELIDSHIPKTCNLCCKSLKAMLRVFFTTNFQTCLATNQVVSGSENLLQKVESSSTFCHKICLCCAFYRPRQTCFAASYSRLILSNQREIRTWVVKHAACFSTRSAAMLRNKLHVFVTRAVTMRQDEAVASSWFWPFLLPFAVKQWTSTLTQDWLFWRKIPRKMLTRAFLSL